MEIPKSLKKKRTLIILKRVFICCLILGISIIIINYFPNLILPDDADYNAIRTFINIIFIILPFYISGVPIKFIDTSFHGIIDAVNMIEKTGTYMVGIKPFPCTKIDIELIVRKDNGKLKKYIAKSFVIKEFATQDLPNVSELNYNADIYKVGDEVYKFYMFKFLYINSKKTDFNYCINCGTENSKDDNYCWKCASERLNFKK